MDKATLAILHPTPPPLQSQANPKLNPTLFAFLLLTTFLALSSSLAFAFLLFSPPLPSTAASSSHLHSASRPLSLLSKPTVLLISLDGFRFGYQFKSPLPNLSRLIANGTQAYPGLIPVFPTLTFPNHYSIATGLYPPYHGIIHNRFLDPATNLTFTISSHNPSFWLGHPLWQAVSAAGLPAATFFWPGSEVHKPNWTCPPNFCFPYNRSVPFDVRVDTVLSFFDLPPSQIPSFITLYFEEPDSQGHQVGPDDPAITQTLIRLDGLLGRLIHGLEKRAVFEDVALIVVGDHGMVGTCDTKLVYLDDLAPWIEIKENWVASMTPLVSIRPPTDVSPRSVVERIREGLGSGKVENGDKLKVFLKEELPERLHYSASDRIPPVIGLVEEGFKVEWRRSDRKECGGAHGYDNAFFSMRTIFIAHGPQFARGRAVASFENVEIYNVVTTILGIKGAPNNGSTSFPSSILLDPPHAHTRTQ